MKNFIIIVMLMNGFVYGQKSVKGINVIEDFVTENYKTPDSILLFAANHKEYSYFYHDLFNKVSNKSPKNKIAIKWIYKDLEPIRKGPVFFDTNISDKEFMGYSSVCFFDISTISTDDQNFCKDGKCSFYFYLKLVDLKNGNVLLKKKYKVSTRRYYYTRTKGLAKVISNDINF